MESNLIQKVKSYFSEEVIHKLSNNLGEDPENVRKGIDIGIPSLLLGFQSHSQSGLTSLLTSARHLFKDFNFDHVFGKFFGFYPDHSDADPFENSNLVSTIFGDKEAGIISGISNYLGIKSSSVSGILGAIVPSIISVLTNKGGNWDPSTIGNLLNNNKSLFTSALPAPLGLGSFGSIFANADKPIELNPASVSDTPITPKEPANEPPIPPQQMPPPVHTQEQVEENKKGAGLWWLLIPILLVGAWFVFGRGCEGNQTNNTLNDTVSSNNLADTALMEDAIDTMNEIAREFVDVKLPDGQSLKAYPSGIEQALIEFLQTDYESLSDDQLNDRWFDFDNLNFETGTANIVPESRQQLENIAAILALFPKAKIKIGGYTDKTGDEALNIRISQERADVVKNFLTEQGLGNQVVGAEGYGSEFAMVSENASDTEREKDRRVAISVRK